MVVVYKAARVVEEGTTHYHCLLRPPSLSDWIELNMYSHKFAIAALAMSVAQLTNTSPVHYDAPHTLSTRQNNDSIDSIISDSPMLSFHRDLVQISSVSNDETEVGEFIEKFLTDNNFTVRRINVTSANTNSTRFDVFATQDTSDQPRPKVILTTHMDTVPPFIDYSTVYANDSADRADIQIHGRGSVDAKACIAAQTFAAMSLLSSSVSAQDLALLFVVGEENSGDGMVAFNESPLWSDINSTSIEGVIFGEPTEGKLATGHKGGATLLITANGTAAHSAYPELGKSAISMILPALSAVDSLDGLTPEKGGLPGSEKFGNSTANLGLISAGTASNVVPAYAESETYIRVAGGTEDEFRKAIMARIALFAPRSVQDLNITFTWGNDPVNLVGDVEGFESQVLNYGTDIPSLKYGSDTKVYLYGPGTIHVAHGPNEYVTIGDLEDSVDGYMRLVADVLGG